MAKKNPVPVEIQFIDTASSEKPMNRIDLIHIFEDETGQSAELFTGFASELYVRWLELKVLSFMTPAPQNELNRRKKVKAP